MIPHMNSEWVPPPCERDSCGNMIDLQMLNNRKDKNRRKKTLNESFLLTSN